MDTLLAAAVIVGLVAVLLVLLVGAIFAVIDDPKRTAWPDDDPTLDVQNHRGDARSLR